MQNIPSYQYDVAAELEKLKKGSAVPAGIVGMAGGSKKSQDEQTGDKFGTAGQDAATSDNVSMFPGMNGESNILAEDDGSGLPIYEHFKQGSVDEITAALAEVQQNQKDGPLMERLGKQSADDSSKKEKNPFAENRGPTFLKTHLSDLGIPKDQGGQFTVQQGLAMPNKELATLHGGKDHGYWENRYRVKSGLQALPGLDQQGAEIKAKWRKVLHDNTLEDLNLDKIFREQKKLLGDDTNQSGRIDFNELEPQSQAIASRQGLDIRTRSTPGAPVHGPAQSFWETNQEAGKEFGLPRGAGALNVRTPLFNNAMEGDSAQAVNDALFDGGKLGIEKAAREADKGLATRVVNEQYRDPNAPISDAGLRQIHAQLSTDLGQPTPASIGPDTVKATLEAVLRSTGAEEDYIRSVVDSVPNKSMTSSNFNSLTNAIQGASTSRQTLIYNENKSTAGLQALDTLQQHTTGIIDAIKDNDKPIDPQTHAALKYVGQENDKAKNSTQEKTDVERATEAKGVAFNEFNDYVRKVIAYTPEEKDTQAQAFADQEIARGNRPLDFNHVQRGHAIAMQRALSESANLHLPDADVNDVMSNYIESAIASSPTIASQYVDLIANIPPGTDPFLVKSVKRGVRTWKEGIVSKHLVQENINLVQNTTTFGTNLKDKTATLESRYAALARGNAAKGFAPVNPKYLKPIQDQIAKNEKIMAISSQNIRVDLPGKDEVPLPLTEANRVMEVQQSIGYLNQVKDALINTDGSIQRGTLTMMNFNADPTTWWTDQGIKIPTGMPFSKGRNIAQILANVAELRARMKSQSAINKDEWDTFIQLYWPTHGDSAEGIKNKLDRQIDWASGVMSLVDPTGKLRNKIGGGGPQVSLKDQTATPAELWVQRKYAANPNISSEDLWRAYSEEHKQ